MYEMALKKISIYQENDQKYTLKIKNIHGAIKDYPSSYSHKIMLKRWTYNYIGMSIFVSCD